MKIAVMFGGTSEERDVSIASGSQVVRALRSKGHEVVPIDTAVGVLDAAAEEKLLASDVRTAPPGSEQLDVLRTGDATGIMRAPEMKNVDVIFLALHGGAGEGGALQALLELTGIPF